MSGLILIAGVVGAEWLRRGWRWVLCCRVQCRRIQAKSDCRQPERKWPDSDVMRFVELVRSQVTYHRLGQPLLGSKSYQRLNF